MVSRIEVTVMVSQDYDRNKKICQISYLSKSFLVISYTIFLVILILKKIYYTVSLIILNSYFLFKMVAQSMISPISPLILTNRFQNSDSCLG